MKSILLAAIMLATTAVTFAEVPVTTGKSAPQFSFTALQQSFGYFRIHRMRNDVVLNWSVNVADEAVQFKIERSFDGSYFFPHAEVMATGDDKYSFKDTEAFPGYLYYRITVYNTDGSSVTSATEMIRIVSRKG